MKLKYPYAMYDNGEFQGARTSKEWAEVLHVSVHLIRDYAREGRAYKGRYTFRAVREDDVGDKRQVNAVITVRDLEEFKWSLKTGAKFVYRDYRKDLVKGSRISSEKVVVVRKFRHIVKLVSLKDPESWVTMSYTELLRQRKDRMKKKKLASGR
ncbi:hypothetical protein [Lacrimispora sp.]|uniref:hypothetical protein n=1 Tax=Lacrimispora sp. TaxID=2719234 RepID=UPI002866FD32|nr:hypothetical protein [Lacrimispora sp.]MDR7813368.1 hypothetical protein [Lacrimispora sp.]